MIYRQIDRSQALAVLRIISEECGYCADQRYDRFVESILAPRPDGGLVCREYRFCGALGFGGKFRNNGNNDNVPYVDCYQEHVTAERVQMIERANARLKTLFYGDRNMVDLT